MAKMLEASIEQAGYTSRKKVLTDVFKESDDYYRARKSCINTLHYAFAACYCLHKKPKRLTFGFSVCAIK
ncbi:hypothetical protein FZC70_06855 [Bacillus subtilis]|nr:hypothetical protein FZC70_06855 [Bacillus subtilis]